MSYELLEMLDNELANVAKMQQLAEREAPECGAPVTREALEELYTACAKYRNALARAYEGIYC